MDIDKELQHLKGIYQQINKLKEGQLIEVVWLDASTSRDVRRLTRIVIETVKRSIGYFITAKYGYIVLYFEATDESSYEILSIPIACIKKITIFSAIDEEGFKRGKKTVRINPVIISIPVGQGTKEIRKFGRDEVIP